MAEFGFITGLKCVGDSDFSRFAQVENGMCDRYFPDQTVKYGDIKDRCTVKYKNDVLVVKFAKLHLIVNFLLSKDKDKPVDTELINLICSDECDDFSWGKLAFETTFPSLRKGAKGKNLKNTIYAKKSKVLKGKKPSFLYKLEGCSWVFHVWIYACIKKLKDKDICQCLPNSPFRICRWKNSSLPTGCSLDRSIFGSSKFVVDNCIPTTAEMKKFKLESFSFVSRAASIEEHGDDAIKNKGKSRTKGGASSSMQEDVSVSDNDLMELLDKVNLAIGK